MSLAAIRWAWTAHDSIKGVDLLVLLALADFHNADTGQCNPRIPTLIDKTGLSRAAVFRALKKLETLGVIDRTREDGRTSYVLRGVPHRDSGVPHRDSGVPHRDSGVPHRDSGVPHRDSATYIRTRNLTSKEPARVDTNHIKFNAALKDYLRKERNRR